MLDLSAAFHTIDHALLVQRLQHRYGIGCTAQKWFQSYLHNKQQSVVVKNTFSSSKPLLHGVQQGSVLGPLLFSLYFAPLEDLIVAHGFDTMIYADDSQLYMAINTSNRSLMLSKLELCTRDILSWCTSNILSCNPTKTEKPPHSCLSLNSMNLYLAYSLTASSFQQFKVHVTSVPFLTPTSN